jgi:exonuclease VII small subunit
MPDELGDIRRRLDVLERRMDSEAGLRAMMDLDQASLTARLNAQDHLLRALAVTQSEHTTRLTRLEEGQQRLEGAVGQLQDGQQRLEGAVGQLQDGQQRLEGAVGRVETGLRTIATLLSEDR